MGLQSNRTIGKKGVTAGRFTSTPEKEYYRLINTTKNANCFFVYADSEFCEIYVKENTPVEFLHISSSLVLAGGTQRIQVVAGNETVADTGSVNSPVVDEKIYRASKTINGFLAIKTNMTGVNSEAQCYREVIVGINPDNILSIPNFYESTIEKL